MDRGFAGLNFMQELVQKDKYFVVRIKNNWKLEFGSETGLIKIGFCRPHFYGNGYSLNNFIIFFNMF